MTKELFEKAKFGDRFVTRGGQEALFLRLTGNAEWLFADFYVKDWGLIRVNRENGKCQNGPDIENDIVGMMRSIPSNLEEAAEDSSLKYSIKLEECGITASDSAHYRAGFKAGAEWMAGQGVTLEGRVCKDEYVAEAPFYYVETENSDDLPLVGDKVVVQIRKK